MRIAQVAPLWETVPPKTYGGTELIVHLLCEELVRQGHEVTLFAAGTTSTAARLIPCSAQPLREIEEEFKLDKTHAQVMAYELKMLGQVFSQAHEFDIIHNHIGFQALPFAELTSTPVVTTLHNALTPKIIQDLFEQYPHQPCISISNYQQKLWPNLTYAGTIYHGIDMSRFNPNYTFEDKKYLAFLGRLSPEKGPHLAIEIAKRLDWKLVLAGKIDRVDRLFYEKELAHLIDGEQICYIGELNHDQKVELLRNAAATLCPVQWPEPFGLVMIESMACGTPVFALRDGSIPEVIDHGVTGFVGDTVENLMEELRDLPAYDRRQCRLVAKRRFSAERMVNDHLRLYKRLIQRKQEEVNPEVSLPAVITPTNVAEIKKASLQDQGEAGRKIRTIKESLTTL